MSRSRRADDESYSREYPIAELVSHHASLKCVRVRVNYIVRCANTLALVLVWLAGITHPLDDKNCAARW